MQTKLIRRWHNRQLCLCFVAATLMGACGPVFGADEDIVLGTATISGSYGQNVIVNGLVVDFSARNSVNGLAAGRTLFGSSMVSVDDLMDLASPADWLKQPSRAFDIWLAGQLSSETLAALVSYDQDSVPPLALRQALAEEFNAILCGDSIYEQQRFAGITLRSETLALVSQNPQGSDLQRLNRLLFEDACYLPRVPLFNRRVFCSSDVNRPFVARSSKFLVSDLADLPSLASRLKQPSRAFDTWMVTEQLSLETKALLANYDPGANPPQDPAPLKQALVEEFNEILWDGYSIYEQQRFSGITLRPVTEHLLGSCNYPSDLRCLNRLLIEDAYQEVLRNQTSDPGFEYFVSQLTNGTSQYVNLTVNGCGRTGPENSIFSFLQERGNPADLEGYEINSIVLEFDSMSISSPGSDPNEDGKWTDFSFQGTIKIMGRAAPGP